jgi:site-specific recombinase XerD
MGQLKENLIEEMKLRNLAESTQKIYIRAIQKFINYSRVPSSMLSIEHVRSYKLYLINSKKSPRTVNQQIAALKFFSYQH